MSTTFFELKPKKNKQKKTTEKLVELTKVVTPAVSSYMTYVDTDGIEKKVLSGFTKNSDGSYVLTRVEVNKYDIEERVSYKFTNVNMHYTYIDNEGHEREFNRYDTLVYNSENSTYFGEVGNIEYTKSKVKLFEK